VLSAEIVAILVDPRVDYVLVDLFAVVQHVIGDYEHEQVEFVALTGEA
jgi:hypothetical protein